MVSTLVSTQDASVNFVSPARGGLFESRFVQREPDYFIVYLSSHAGCDQACRFCHLTQTRQTGMTPASLGDYLLQAERVLDHYGSLNGPAAHRVHFNFMARGEPLLNPALTAKPDLLFTTLGARAQHGFGLPSRFNVSTIMPAAAFADARASLSKLIGTDPRTVLFYSAYSLRRAFRRRWLPKALQPDQALDEIAHWQRATGNEVVLHNALIAGENDSPDEAQEIAAAAVARGIRARFNLVRYNPWSPAQGREPSESRLQAYLDAMAQGLAAPASRIVPRVGFDVKASCGMFVEQLAA